MEEANHATAYLKVTAEFYDPDATQIAGITASLFEEEDQHGNTIFL